MPFRGAVTLLFVFVIQSSAFAAAWPVTHKWSDTARPGDPTSGSFGWEYGREAVAIASSMTAAGERWDCSKFAMSVLVRYAQKHGLEVVFTCPDPNNHWAVSNVSSNDPRFNSFQDFVKFYSSWINAEMVATLNTYPITYDDWRSGDVVMMRWNQLGDANPFPGRDVWHTYFLGEPDKLIFYGNIDGEDGPNPTPLPITATAESSTLQEVRTSAAVYGASPRRWNILKDAVIPPATPIQNAPSVLAPKNATVTADKLNVRATPSTHGQVIGQLSSGDVVSFEGNTPDGQWDRVRLKSGDVAYVSASFVQLGDAKVGFSYESDPAPTPGFDGAMGN
jgi:hypothetical protein